MNLKWKQLGGQAAIGLAIVGFLLIFLGWNGAATYDREPAQLPYVISGGIAGLAVVVMAAALMIVNAQREDRAALLNGLAELKEAMERMSLAAAGGTANGASTAGRLAEAEAAGLVVAGPTTYHRPSCTLLDGRGVLPTITLEVAEERGLSACRACDAADISLPVAEREPATRRRRSRS
ncbi:MAG TPA: hypothetical protein VM143_09250 [Acidimicrobiales bacterium]|nr:hypothetical protein [Acidimicrobiales bacterium]